MSLADAPPPLPEVVIPSQFPEDLVFDLERVAAGLDPDIGDDPAAPPAWLADAAAYEARIEALVALADFLGAPAGAMAVIRAAGARGGRNRGFWLDVSSPWALACMAGRWVATRYRWGVDATTGSDPFVAYAEWRREKPPTDLALMRRMV